MNRYIGFCFQDYEERGGWNDVLEDSEGKACSFESIEEVVSLLAREASKELFDIGQVVDLHTGEVVVSIRFRRREPYSHDAMWVKDKFLILEISDKEENYTLSFDKGNKLFLDEKARMVRDEHFLPV